MPEVTAAEWNTFLAAHPEAHLLQTAPWGDLKAAFGWQVRRVVGGEAGAQILFRHLGPGVDLAYIPRGPVGKPTLPFWEQVEDLCRGQGAFVLKVEPDAWEAAGSGTNRSDIPPGAVPSPQTIQPRRTLVINLDGSEDDLLLRMKQKTRYNIRLAQKKGVFVTESADVAAFHRLALETSRRDGFFVHSQAYYQQAYDLFHDPGRCILLMAYAGDELLAGLMAFMSGPRAWYLFGASSDTGRNQMATYLLQWEAMRLAKSAGCCDYNLWGVPDCEEDELERQFASRGDGLWGVYRFKRGFGGTLRRTAGAFDRVYKPSLYSLYKLYLRVKREPA